MSETNQYVEYLTDLSKTVLSLGPEALTIVVCIVVGYLLKAASVTRKYSGWVPLICVVVGAVFYTFVSDPASMPKEIASPRVAQVGYGSTMGLIAWAIHRAFLKGWLDKKLFGDPEAK